MSEPRPSLLRTLGWAAYLGMSWTWCIGMFLPILLMRDFGVWAFAVFAIPNVVGAAGMGWVLRRPGAAEALRARHPNAILWFSLVTIAFHFYWFMWMLSVYGLRLGSGMAAGGALLMALSRLTEKRDEDRTSLAIGVFCVSLAAMGLFFAMGWAGVPASGTAAMNRELAWLAPVCIFGFLFCPYLDATFLRARERLPGAAGSLAFTLGFGVCFLLMILFTLVYAGYGYTSGDEAGARDVPLPILAVIGGHWFIQIVFTFHVHAREAVRIVKGNPDGPTSTTGRRTKLTWWGVTLAIALGLLWVPGYASMSVGEVIYRLFMTFYGLVFPAYVWLCMIPTRDGHSGTLGPRGRRKLVTLGLAVLLASPCFWMGFIERETWWLAPGLGIVLLSRLVVIGRRGPRVGEEGFVRGGV